MAEPSRETTEVTLGTGKLLGIFLGLVVICAVFFTMGYMLGRGSVPSAGKTEVVASVPSSSAPAAKPSAVNKNSEPAAQPCVAGSPKCPTANGVAAESAANSPETQAPTVSSSAQPASNTSAPVKPEQPVTGPRPGGTIIIQVAAVSKQEDAEILVSALRRKQYPAFVTNTSSDPLFHIQVGPFSDPKEADAMRGRLVNDGYNAIVKK
ncbi:MAG TPA: SPOR domain-containing protein [Candidatus Angelobacter sp.]|nr:SPOR domain-containing protein [Candidatus Angelobacter sp.]